MGWVVDVEQPPSVILYISEVLCFFEQLWKDNVGTGKDCLEFLLEDIPDCFKVYLFLKVFKVYKKGTQGLEVFYSGLLQGNSRFV